MNGYDLGKELARCFNSFDTEENARGLIKVLISEHRTIQQTITGDVIIGFVKMMAYKYDQGLFDARNEYACKACKVMWEALKKEFSEKFADDMPTKLPMI
jgi:uncharacterized protein (DUF2164 family)